MLGGGRSANHFRVAAIYYGIGANEAATLIALIQS